MVVEVAEVTAKIPLYADGLTPETVTVLEQASAFEPMVRVAVPEDQLAPLTLNVCWYTGSTEVFR